MIRLTRFVVCLALLGAWPGLIRAQGDDEKREGPRAEAERADREKEAQHQELELRMAELKRRIAELRADDKPDQAAELEKVVKNLILKMQNEPKRHAPDAVHREIEELRKAGRNDEAAKLEQLLRDEHEKRARASAEKQEHQAREARERLQQAVRKGQPPHEAGAEELERNVHHILEAAKLLTAAGLHEQAEQLRRQAEMMRAKFTESTERRPELQELYNQLRQQNERIERLEQIVNKLLQQSVTSSVKLPLPAAEFKVDSKMLAYSQTVIKKYDKNGDGVLTKDEWSSMTKDPTAADKDSDGKITAEELAVWTWTK